MIKSRHIILLLTFILITSACSSAQELACNRGLGLLVENVALGNGQKIQEYVSEKIGETQTAVVYEGRDGVGYCLVQFWQGEINEGSKAMQLEVNMDSGHISAGDLGGEELMNLLMNAFVPLPK